MNRIVITHHEMGIFVGASLGFAFWSNLDAGGQHLVVTFDDEKDAREFVSEWVPAQDPDTYSYVTVDSVSEWATVAELDKAGLGELTALLLYNSPAVGLPC